MVSLIYAAVFMFGMAVSGHAATYYVATTGNNSNPGTETQPWQTVTFAVATMVAGDTTYVRGGTYTERRIRFGRSGTQSAPIKLLNYPGDNPIITCGPGATDADKPLIENTAGYNLPIGWITIEGFEIKDCWHGLKWHNLHDSIIRRNWIHDSIQSGVLATSGTRILFERNIISKNALLDTSPPMGHGLYMNGSAYTIVNNILYDNHNSGIILNGSPTSFYNPAKHPSAEFANSYNWIIANNTIAYGRLGAAVNVWGSTCNNARIENNIIYENASQSSSSATQGVTFTSASCTGIQIRNNHFYASGSGGTVAIGAGATEGVHYTQSGNVVNVSPPAFVNAGATLPSSPDFRLTASAPVNIARTNEFPNNSTNVVGAFKTVATPTAVIHGNKIVLTFPMNTAVPMQNLSSAGVSFSCTANVCPGSPVVSSVSRAVGTDSNVEIVLSGITSDACLSHADPVTVSYAAASGLWTGNDNIGVYPGLHQKIFSITNLAVTNACTGTGSTGYPAGYHIYYKFNEGTGTNANDESANNLDCTLTNSASWGSGKSGSALSVANGTQQYCAVPWGNGVNPSTQSMTIFMPVYIEAGAENALHYIGGPDLGTNQRAYVCGENGIWKVSIQATSCQSTATSNLAVTAGWNVLTLRFDSGTDIATLYKGAVAGTGGAAVAYTSFTFASDFKIGKLHTNAVKNKYLFDDFLVYLSLESPATLAAAFDAAPPPLAETFAQAAVQCQGVILDSAGSPIVVGPSVQVIEVPTGGGAVLLFQVHCTNVADCAQTAFKLVYAKNGAGVWQQVPDTETADGTWMWGVTTEANLNNGLRSTRLTGSCAMTTGSTQVTAAQIPSVDLPQDGCTVLAYIVRVNGAPGQDYFDYKLRTEANLDFTGGYTQTARVRVVNPMASGIGF